MFLADYLKHGPQWTKKTKQLLKNLNQKKDATPVQIKTILDTFIEDKSKLKEILRDQSNNFNNQYLFGSHFEKKIKNFNAEQKSNPLLTGLKKEVTGINCSNSRTFFNKNEQQQLFQGASLQCHPKGRGQISKRRVYSANSNKVWLICKYQVDARRAIFESMSRFILSTSAVRKQLRQFQVEFLHLL